MLRNLGEYKKTIQHDNTDKKRREAFPAFFMNTN